MSTVNPLAREISAKIVFCGPALSGKTTSLTRVFESVRPNRRGELVTLATQGDRTIFFDFLPLHVKQVRGLGVRFQLYTVPGQTYYAATRELVLKGADGVVFVADSGPSAQDANQESWAELGRNVTAMGLDLATMPLVVQWNKRDLPDAVPLTFLESTLNHVRAPAYETVSKDGTGILDTFRAISKLVIRKFWLERGKKPGPDGDPLGGGDGEEEAPKPEPEKPAAMTVKLAGDASDSLITRLRALAESQESEIPPRHDGLSFAPLTPDAELADVVTVEAAIGRGLYAQAVTVAANAVAALLDSLPGVPTGDGRGVRAMLLGLDGREYLKLSRIASLPEESVEAKHALFALHMLVSTHVRSNALRD
jgi:signal recognition particle receptor subunit beta